METGHSFLNQDYCFCSASFSSPQNNPWQSSDFFFSPKNELNTAVCRCERGILILNHQKGNEKGKSVWVAGIRGTVTKMKKHLAYIRAEKISRGLTIPGRTDMMAQTMQSFFRLF